MHPKQKGWEHPDILARSWGVGGSRQMQHVIVVVDVVSSLIL